MKIPIYNKHTKITDLVVDTLFNKPHEAYCIFRPNGEEIEVRMKNGEIEDCLVDLVDVEIEYFKKEYKKLTE